MKDLKLSLIILTIFLTINNVKAVPVPPPAGAGTPVFDVSTYGMAVQSFQAMQQMIEHNVEMAKQLGDGNFTPSTINWATDWYNKCGGGKFVLPDWFPHPKLNICADTKKTVELGVDWYEKELLIDVTRDDPKTIKEKSKKQTKALKRVRSYTLAKSVMEMQRGEEDAKAIIKLQEGLNSADNQIKIQKIQTQIMIQTLAELQKMNIKQAEITHIMSLKN